MGRIVYQDLAMVIASAANQDLVSVVGTAAVRIRMHSWELTSEAIAADLLNLKFHRITASGSAGALSTTEELADEADSPSVAVVRTEDTTPGADGGSIMSYRWEQLGPVGHVWTPETRPTSLVSQGFAITCETAVVATLGGWICWEEV